MPGARPRSTIPADGIEIDRESPVPPSHQLAAYLRDQIKSGKIKPGRRIPSLTEIEQASGLGRDAIQKATRKLKAEGLIEHVPGMGLFVVEQPPEGG